MTGSSPQTAESANHQAGLDHLCKVTKNVHTQFLLQTGFNVSLLLLDWGQAYIPHA